MLLMALLVFAGCGEKYDKVTSVRNTVQNAELEMGLWDIATSSYSETNPVALATMEEAYSPLMAKLHPAYRKACIWVGWVALALFVVFLYPTIRRSKFWNLILMLPYAGLLLLAGKYCIMPTWLMMLTVPLIAYVVCYPLLYTGLSRSYVWISPVVTVVAAALYLWSYVGVVEDGGFSLLHLVLLLVMLAVSFLEIDFLYRGNVDDICPHCGYFASHKMGESRLTGTEVSYGTDVDTVYDGTTERTVDNTKYVTKHYHDEVYDTKTVTKSWDTDRTCMRCGGQFITKSTTESTTRKRVK